jgi:hypothetical protein
MGPAFFPPENLNRNDLFCTINSWSFAEDLKVRTCAISCAVFVLKYLLETITLLHATRTFE